MFNIETFSDEAELKNYMLQLTMLNYLVFFF
jgi:hypothetical protein